MKFIDEVTVTVESGAGGPGSVSFRREKFVPFGGPDGGDGGSGGSVIFRGSLSLSTLIDLKYKSILKAEKGQAGAGRKKSGRSGKDLVIEVPFGTEVHLLEPIITIIPAVNTGESSNNESHNGDEQITTEDANLEWSDDIPDIEEPIVETKKKKYSDVEYPRFFSDITPEQPEVIVVKGGQGGKGNDFFKSATRQAPDYAQPGGSSQGFLVKLSLKLMADVALVGFPNAGKSSLLRGISAAKPQVGAYPFTTLSPSLGVVRVTEGAHFVAADIPGLIEGAHSGKGLGIRFLKHIERTRLLLHLVDGEVLVGAEQASEDDLILELINRIHAINHELSSFSSLLQSLPQVIVITKRDLWHSQFKDASLLHDRIKEALTSKSSLLPPPVTVTSVSTASGEGVKELTIVAWKILEGKFE